jgi:hypothetical protein
MAGVQFPAGARNLSILHSVQTCSVDNPGSSPAGKGRSVKLTAAKQSVGRMHSFKLKQ